MVQSLFQLREEYRTNVHERDNQEDRTDVQMYRGANCKNRNEVT
jgi:hypothetical protein